MEKQPKDKKNMQSNIFPEFTSRNKQVAMEMKKPMCSLVAPHIRIFISFRFKFIARFSPFT